MVEEPPVTPGSTWGALQWPAQLAKAIAWPLPGMGPSPAGGATPSCGSAWTATKWSRCGGPG